MARRRARRRARSSSRSSGAEDVAEHLDDSCRDDRAWPARRWCAASRARRSSTACTSCMSARSSRWRARRSVREAAIEQPILIVTDDERGSMRGGVINFIEVERNVRFEISLIAADRARLKIDSALLSVAARVERRPQAVDLRGSAACSDRNRLRDQVAAVDERSERSCRADAFCAVAVASCRWRRAGTRAARRRRQRSAHRAQPHVARAARQCRSHFGFEDPRRACRARRRPST